MKRPIQIAWLVAVCGVALGAQDIRVRIPILDGGRRLAVPDIRGSGGAQAFMGTLNQTLWNDLDDAEFFRMIPKTSYPLTAPQQPSDFRRPAGVSAQAPPGGLIAPPRGDGLWMSDWSSPPATANYLAFGYSALQNGVLVFYAWLFDLSRASPDDAQVFGRRYLGSVDEGGARKVAHEFAADLLAVFGQKSLVGTKIVFVSNRAGNSRNKEIWMMDYDGSNQRRITNFDSLSMAPAVSPDSSQIAFSRQGPSGWGIFLFSLDPVRQLTFHNRMSSLNTTPSFTPDGKHIVYSSTVSGWPQIYIADLDGSHSRRISSVNAIEVEPKVNPKTGADIVFVSGRSGPQQIYRMNLDGADVERLTPGNGEASNPSWHPDGGHIAFSWTQGFAAGDFNVFLMDVATRQYAQLTYSQGRNENPSWAPDGKHLVFMSTRTGKSEIWSMLADGTHLRQLTSEGRNESPVWGQ